MLKGNGNDILSNLDSGRRNWSVVFGLYMTGANVSNVKAQTK
jgi:hypothetical protein